MSTYGEKITKLRKANNLTQAELGEKLNVSAQAVSKWENDLSEPDIGALKKMSSLFNVSLDELLDNNDNVKNAEQPKVETASTEVVERVDAETPEDDKKIVRHCCSCKKEITDENYKEATVAVKVKSGDTFSTKYEKRIYCNECYENKSHMMGYCSVCGKKLYNNDYKEASVAVKATANNNTSVTYEKKKYCNDCYEKAKAGITKTKPTGITPVAPSVNKPQKPTITKASTRQHVALSTRFWVGIGVGAAVALIFAIIYITELASGRKIIESATLTANIVSSIFAVYSTFAFFSVIIWKNNTVSELMKKGPGFRGPGVIFELSLDGIIWLIGVKLLFWLLSKLLTLIIFILKLIVAFFMSMFVFPLELIRHLRGKKPKNKRRIKENMKNLKIFLICCLSSLCLCFLCLTACDLGGSPSTTSGQTQSQEQNQPEETGLDITGITFSSQSYDYDGEEKELLISGSLPEGVSVSYESNKGTNSGTYNAKATLSGEGYKTLNLSATLTINKLSYDMTGISWNYSNSFDYDGTQKSVAINEGSLPEGVTVKSYTNAEKTDAGSYSATVSFNYDTLNHNAPSVSACSWVINKINFPSFTFSDQSVKYDEESHLPEVSGLPEGTTKTFYIDNVKTTGVTEVGKYVVKLLVQNKNYIDYNTTCNFKIRIDPVKYAKKIIDAFGSIPDPWAFLPESFAPSYHVANSVPDYSDFYNLSNIPKNGIGIQLNLVIGLLNKTSVVLDKVNVIYSVFNTLESAYAAFLDQSEENIDKTFSYTKESVSLSLSVSESTYSISATVSGFEINIFADTENNSYGARIQITESNVLKYEVGENRMKIALTVLNVSATQIEFVRDDTSVLGYVYEHLVVGEHELSSPSALIEVGPVYTTLIGTKGDFILTADSRNCEVYLNSTGRLVGTEVREKLGANGKEAGNILYETLWYNLYEINGITSIKKIDEANGTNPDTIYINGVTEDTIHTTLYGGLNLKAASRRYDIEFKTMYFYTLNGDEYEEVSYEIPMMFIQEEKLADFKNNFEDKNHVAVTLTASVENRAAVYYGYHVLIDVYDVIKEAVTFEAINDYCK